VRRSLGRDYYEDHKPGKLKVYHYDTAVNQMANIDCTGIDGHENLLIAGMSLFPNITVPDVSRFKI
jgi:hypothetical protein